MSMSKNGWCIEGDCVNGYGTLVTADGITYIGQFKNRNPHGDGEVRYPGGKINRGEFFNGFPHGAGKLTLADGSQYIGMMAEGVPCGEGEIFFLTAGHRKDISTKTGSCTGMGNKRFRTGQNL